MKKSSILLTATAMLVTGLGLVACDNPEENPGNFPIPTSTWETGDPTPSATILDPTDDAESPDPSISASPDEDADDVFPEASDDVDTRPTESTSLKTLDGRSQRLE